MIKNNGFTLMELMVVLAVVGIMTAVSVPAIMQIVPDLRLKNAASELYGDLNMGKSTAVMVKEPVRVLFNPAGGYEVRRLGADRTLGGGDDTIIKTVTFADFGGGVRLGRGNAAAPIDADFGANNITYNGNDTVYDVNGMVDDTGYVYLTNDNNILCYAVGNPTLAGAVRMRKTTGNQWISE